MNIRKIANTHKNYRTHVWNIDKPKVPELLVEEAPDGKYNHIVLDSSGNLIENRIRERA